MKKEKLERGICCICKKKRYKKYLKNVTKFRWTNLLACEKVCAKKYYQKIIDNAKKEIQWAKDCLLQVDN